MGEPSRIADYVTLPGGIPVFVPEGYRLDIMSPLSAGNNALVTISEERGSSVSVYIAGGGTLAITGRAWVTTNSSSLIAHYARVGDAPTWGSTGAGTLSVAGTVLIGGPGVGAMPTQYLGVGNSPATGVWTVAIKATTSGSNISINGTPVFAGVITADIVAGTIYIVTYPVVSGTTYTVTGGTVVDGTVSV
jgi:hypothetical protein